MTMLNNKTTRRVQCMNTLTENLDKNRLIMLNGCHRRKPHPICTILLYGRVPEIEVRGI